MKWPVTGGLQARRVEGSRIASLQTVEVRLAIDELGSRSLNFDLVSLDPLMSWGETRSLN